MTLLVAGLVLFFIPHSVGIVNPLWRDHMVERYGLMRWQAGFALLALMGMALIVEGYSLARQAPLFLYWPSLALRYGTLALMLLVFPLLVATYLPGRIRNGVKHPMLVATTLWATAHLLCNGTLADLLLCGTFLIWSVAQLISAAYRTQPPIEGLPVSRFNDAIAVIVGLAFYAATLFITHTWLIGVAVLP